jgi:hypothetical protein
MNTEAVDLVRDVLDHEIVDRDDLPCGMVDDVELDGAPGAALTVVALLVGPGAWTERLPWGLGRVARLFAGCERVRIAWAEVALSGDRIKLRSSAASFGLDFGERRPRRWLERMPRA